MTSLLQLHLQVREGRCSHRNHLVGTAALAVDHRGASPSGLDRQVMREPRTARVLGRLRRVTSRFADLATIRTTPYGVIRLGDTQSQRTYA